MKRRLWLSAGVAAGAAAAGGGWAWWQRSAAAAAASDAAIAGLWMMRFEQPGGGELQLSALRGRPLLINFWATWCPPCIREMPLLDSFYRRQSSRGWQVVGLAVDGAKPVRQFLSHQPVGFPIGMAGMAGIELARSLGNAGGQLPFTVLLDREGRLHLRFLGAVDERRLTDWARQIG